MRSIYKKILPLFGLLVALAACSLEEPPQTETTTSSTESLYFSRFMAVGDNYISGYQSAALTKRFQDYSFVAQIARQVGTPNFQQPLLGYPGLGSESIAGFGAIEVRYLDDPATPKTVNPDPVIYAVPFSDYPDFDPNLPYYNEDVMLYPLPYSNLGIPGIFVDDILKATTRLRSHSKSGLIDVILRNPLPEPYGYKTAFEQIKLFVPSVIACWVGMYDVLEFAQFKNTAKILVNGPTPADDFAAGYKQLMDSLLSTGAVVVVANLPDIIEMPYFNSVPKVVIDTVTNTPLLDSDNQPIPLVGVSEGDKLTLAAKSAIKQGYGLPADIPGSIGQPIPPDMVLDSGEINQIRTAIADYNAIIDTVCAARKIPVVDMYSYFQQLKDGIQVAGTTFTDAYLTGGFYSPDGIHPTVLGNTLIANEWISTMNNDFGISLPPVDIVKIMAETQPMYFASDSL